MRRHLLKFLIVLSPLVLTACGEGWEMVRITDLAPYGNSRTAGSGIAYVRMNLAPPQDLKIINIQRDITPSVSEELNAMFDAEQRK